jgi:hypothetical protein
MMKEKSGSISKLPLKDSDLEHFQTDYESAMKIIK